MTGFLVGSPGPWVALCDVLKLPTEFRENVHFSEEEIG